MDERQAGRDVTFGTIGLIWGILIVVNGIFDPTGVSPTNAYDAGRLGAVIFGLLFAVVGFYYRRRGYQTRRRLQEDRSPS